MIPRGGGEDAEGEGAGVKERTARLKGRRSEGEDGEGEGTGGMILRTHHFHHLPIL